MTSGSGGVMRSSGRASPGLSEGKDLGGAALARYIWDFQCVAHSLAWNPAVHLGDAFEDLAVQRCPIHAKDVDQHKSPVGGSADVVVVQVEPIPPARRLPVPRIDHLGCPAYLLELRIARPGPPLLCDLLGDRVVHGSNKLQEDD